MTRFACRLPRLHLVSACLALCAGVGLSMPWQPAQAGEVPVQAGLAASDATAQRFGLRLPATDTVAFHGAVNFDKAGGAGGGAMLYPAPGLVGLLAAVATHAIVSGTMRDAEKERIRTQADKVLAPYQTVLGTYTHQELMQASLAHIKTGGAKQIIAQAAPPTPGDIVVDSVPLFYLTQDHQALILDNAISIKTAGRATPYETIIRIVSPERGEGAGPDLWLGDDAGMLKWESARMYAQALDIALADMATPGAPALPYKTVRYNEGANERMERAQLISESCDYLVLRTLRGNLMAVPRKAAAGCGAAATPAG
ncbi:hypothetical protein IV454_19950 [Massilia antarctica]|uniref:Uncharacterized protein n=1 Tax=Massilia antarctica TaxID=2765360 RepID=A0AA49A6N0_9BURK|nr:hypothetical protein [Massilia antarctica]QPI47837.1 hypothetical protein IV454_19950 [Massilia antarctica]